MSTQLIIDYFLNGRHMRHAIHAGITVLDMLRSVHHLSGTKKGCNEGDCGACTVSVGQWTGGGFVYQAVAACIYPAAKLHGCHLITIEGLAGADALHIIQEKIIDHHGAQCGYCSPGIVMSFFSLFAMKTFPDNHDIALALDGNICRCTGYEGIRDAGRAVIDSLKETPDHWESEVLPDFAEPTARALKTHGTPVRVVETDAAPGSPVPVGAYHIPGNLDELFALWREYPDARLIAGGTDLYVDINRGRIRADHLIDISRIQGMDDLSITREEIRFGAGITVSRLMSDPGVLAAIPVFRQVGQRMASAQIRSAATVVGNIANASPVGDLSVVLLALDARLFLASQQGTRTLALDRFFLDYKDTALRPEEIVTAVTIPVRPELTVRFEKSSKRKAVDIASVNSCVAAAVQNGVIVSLRAAFGGVAPIPAMARLDEKLPDQPLDHGQIMETAQQVASRFSTISDIRGDKAFRATLVKNHMIKHLHRIQAGGETHE